MRIPLLSLLFFLFGPQVLTADWSVVNVREAKAFTSTGEEAVVLDVLTSGMMVDVMRTEGGWAQVKLPGSVELGWIETRFLEAASQAGKAAGRPSGERWLSQSEMGRVRARLNRTGSSLAGIEMRLDSLLRTLAGIGMYSRPGVLPEAVGPEVPEPLQLPATGEPELEEPIFEGELREYSWSNRFVMGQYVKGGEDLYGLGFSRMIDDHGSVEVDIEACYGMGDDSGSSDDFLDWNLGLRYNLKPATYRIYPYLAAYGGMRYHLRAVPGRSTRQLLQFSPGAGVTAELSRVFTLGIEARAVFLFSNGERFDEGRVVFSCLYRY